MRSDSQRRHGRDKVRRTVTSERQQSSKECVPHFVSLHTTRNFQFTALGSVDAVESQTVRIANIADDVRLSNPILPRSKSSCL